MYARLTFNLLLFKNWDKKYERGAVYFLHSNLVKIALVVASNKKNIELLLFEIFAQFRIDFFLFSNQLGQCFLSHIREIISLREYFKISILVTVARILVEPSVILAIVVVIMSLYVFYRRLNFCCDVHCW